MNGNRRRYGSYGDGHFSGLCGASRTVPSNKRCSSTAPTMASTRQNNNKRSSWRKYCKSWALTWAMKKLPTHCPFVGGCGISTSRRTGLLADESPEKEASSEVFPVLGVGRDVSAMTLPALAAGALFVAEVRSGAPNDDAARPGVVKAENEAGSIGASERRLSVLGCCEPVTLVPAHCGPLRTNVGSYTMGAPCSRLAPVLPSFLMNNSLGSESIPLPRLRRA